MVEGVSIVSPDEVMHLLSWEASLARPQPLIATGRGDRLDSLALLASCPSGACSAFALFKGRSGQAASSCVCSGIQSFTGSRIPCSPSRFARFISKTTTFQRPLNAAANWSQASLRCSYIRPAASSGSLCLSLRQANGVIMRQRHSGSTGDRRSGPGPAAGAGDDANTHAAQREARPPIGDDAGPPHSP
jgi:hypothetical protein